MTTVIAHFIAKPGQRDVVIGMLANALQITISKLDCYRAEMFTDDDSDHRFCRVQEWTSS